MPIAIGRFRQLSTPFMYTPSLSKLAFTVRSPEASYQYWLTKPLSDKNHPSLTLPEGEGKSATETSLLLASVFFCVANIRVFGEKWWFLNSNLENSTFALMLLNYNPKLSSSCMHFSQFN